MLNFKIVDVRDKQMKTVSGVVDYAKDAEKRGIIIYDSTGFEGMSQ